MHDRLEDRVARLTRRDSRRKFQAILKAAADLFLERGFVQTTMDAVAERAQVSKRTVYGHFDNKEDLFSAVLRQLCESVVPNEAGSLAGTAIEVLTELGTIALTGIYAPQQIALLQTVISDSRQFPEIGKMFMDGPVGRSHAVINAYLAEQVAAGAIRLKYPELAASQFLGMLKTDLHMRLLLSQKPRVTKAGLREIAAHTAELFLCGVGGRL